MMEASKNLLEQDKIAPPTGSDTFHIISGSHKKPVVTKQLVDFFSRTMDSEGFLYTGYPLIGTINGANAVDAMLISKKYGLIVFDIVEAQDLGDYEERQDDIYTKLQSYLLLYKELKQRKELRLNITVITFAPQQSPHKPESRDEYPLITDIKDIKYFLKDIRWEDEQTYNHLHSVIQNITSIRRSPYKRNLENKDSRGTKLKELEDSIANLDHSQANAVINTYKGIQRIRGLAGSGKTIVLALKVAYLHAMNPDWDIAITFHTRSLKNQFETLINRFIIERTKQEPDWDKISIIHAWGAAGDKSHGGIYYNFCKDHGEEYLDFSKAKDMFGSDDAFAGACNLAIDNNKGEIIPTYDIILVDEAQDFSSKDSSPFLMLCYELLKEPKRFVYAYDELQNLSTKAMPSPEEIFGLDKDGIPRVSNDNFNDIVLHKCYRNSRPVLATAHALGFGIYANMGLVQMFKEYSIWFDIGYKVHSGELAKGNKVVLERTDDTSPKFLEQLQPKDDLILFKCFQSDDEQISFLVSDIIKNLKEEELLPRDIIVINPDPLTTKKAVSKARTLLYEQGYNNSIAGVSNSPDVFQEKDAITFTGIHRAKGNEAGLVYIINTQYCYGGYSLARKRNMLFTAMTRSKAWVRVLGYGSGMDSLCKEYSEIEANKYRLDFTYPTDEEMKEMNLLHKDRNRAEEKNSKVDNYSISKLLSLLEAGDLNPSDIDQETLKRLKYAISTK